ncbi:unnamed protein product [Didymodactylos carnosus]|uniref:Uncharacterized protein n=1 Tax=Didymodactylos carnosus TaxID=1234261 RepID=A0A815VYZ8_9BILA|nr:unnamed protein product [Didymodactylos carnosus]CAF4396665.1 unnamed protein product [Didymodactylos carnosus]CAF4457441.1 unnamed protein product [Didymodactylos carnosus]
MARGAIPKELREMLSYSRALGFRAKRTGDVRLRVESTRIRNIVRSELKQFRQSQLVKQLAERHKPRGGSMMFWNRTKKHFRNCSSSLRGFLLPSGETVKEPSTMADLAADYYEKLFEEPVVYRPHPTYDVYEDSQRQIPLVTYPEIPEIKIEEEKTFVRYTWSLAIHSG